MQQSGQAPGLGQRQRARVDGRVGQQAIGTWLRHPLWAILLPVPFELIGRGLSGSSMLGAAILGLACGYLAWKTGGLEASILLRTAVLVDPTQADAAWNTLITDTRHFLRSPMNRHGH